MVTSSIARFDHVLMFLARPGQALILTKAIGTGVIMAAHMRLKAKGPWLQGA